MDIDTATAHFAADEPLSKALEQAWETLAAFQPDSAIRTGLPAWFSQLDRVLTALGVVGSLSPVQEVMHHIDYLADKAAVPPSAILAGEAFTAHQEVILDALANISAVLDHFLCTRPEALPIDIPAEVFAAILQAEQHLEGWCSREKSLAIVRHVLRLRPLICVEIGVFGGRSLIPCAAALRHLGAGEIYGIEAWSPNVATEVPTGDANDDWWTNVDFPRIKRDFYRFVAATGLTAQVRVVEAPSGRAATLFSAIDFLHIDGSHSAINAAEDVILYARKVRSGGIVIFDDINWQSTGPALALLDTFCETIEVLTHPETRTATCAILRRR